MAKRDVRVGVGMTKFERSDRDFTDLCKDDITDAVGMAKADPSDLEQAFAGYVNGLKEHYDEAAKQRPPPPR